MARIHKTAPKDPMSIYTDYDAVLSPAGDGSGLWYRFSLWREWEGGAGRVLWIMLNPSTADGRQDDQTLRKIAAFSMGWGFQRLDVGNLYALQATDPNELRKHNAHVAIGPDNDRWIERMAGNADQIVLAWGNCSPHLWREKNVVKLLKTSGKPLVCLGMTQKGCPTHPLMLSYATTRRPYVAPWGAQ